MADRTVAASSSRTRVIAPAFLGLSIVVVAALMYLVVGAVWPGESRGAPNDGAGVDVFDDQDSDHANETPQPPSEPSTSTSGGNRTTSLPKPSLDGSSEPTVEVDATPTDAPPPSLVTTTAPTTTTTVPVTTTTTPPVPPSTTTAPNVEVVGAFEPPLEAVGESSGDATRFVQLRLLQLGFWNAGADGEYGVTTKQSVMAFQKYLGLDPTGKVDDVTAAFLTNVTERAHGRSDTGDLIEIDKERQLLFVIRDGKTVWTFNTSTGNGLPYEEPDRNSPGEVQRGVALTPDGLWTVNRERPEGWWEGDLGEIYRPKYFRGGIAVHGSYSVPNYPASHGCVRVSIPAMDFIWEQNLMPMGMTVWVHSGPA